MFYVSVLTMGQQEGGLHGNNRMTGPAENHLLGDREQKEFQWLFCKVTILIQQLSWKGGICEREKIMFNENSSTKVDSEIMFGTFYPLFHLNLNPRGGCNEAWHWEEEVNPLRHMTLFWFLTVTFLHYAFSNVGHVTVLIFTLSGIKTRL